MITVRNPWPAPEELGNPDQETEDKKTAPPQYRPCVFGTSEILTGKKSFAPRCDPAGSLPTLARIADWTLYLGPAKGCRETDRVKVTSDGDIKGAPAPAQSSANDHLREGRSGSYPRPGETLGVHAANANTVHATDAPMPAAGIEPSSPRRRPITPLTVDDLKDGDDDGPCELPTSMDCGEHTSAATRPTNIPTAIAAFRANATTAAPAPAQASVLPAIAAAPPLPAVAQAPPLPAIAAAPPLLAIVPAPPSAATSVPTISQMPAPSSVATVPTRIVGTSKSRVIAVEKVGNAKIPKKRAIGNSGDSSVALALPSSNSAIPPKLPGDANPLAIERPKDMVMAFTAGAHNYCVKLPCALSEFDSAVTGPFASAPPNATLQFISGDEKEETVPQSSTAPSDREGLRSSLEKKGRRSRSRSPAPSRSHSHSRSRSRSGSARKQRHHHRKRTAASATAERSDVVQRSERSDVEQRASSSSAAAASSSEPRAVTSSRGGLCIRVQDLKLLYNLQHLEAIKFALLCLAPFARQTVDVDDINVSLGHVIMEHNQRAPKYYSAHGALKYWNDEVFHEKITMQSVMNFHTKRLRDAGAREDLISPEVNGTLKDLAALGYACRCLARDLRDHQRTLPARHD